MIAPPGGAIFVWPQKHTNTQIHEAVSAGARELLYLSEKFFGVIWCDFVAYRYLLVAKEFTLGKAERLKSRKQTEQLFSEGNKITIAPFRIHYSFTIAEKTSLHPIVLRYRRIKFGVGVGKRNFKKAVDRNRIKRLIREAYRLQKKLLKEKLQEKESRLSVFFIYTGKDLPVYKEVYEKIGKGLDKLRLILNEIK